MGSKCSILNDTNHEVWITHGINWPSLDTAVKFLLGLAALGVGGINRNAGLALGLVNTFAGKLLLCIKEAERRNIDVSKHLIKPGEKYTWSGSLSLHMRVYVLNEKRQKDERVCFTGPTADSENVYPISEYFKNLDV